MATVKEQVVESLIGTSAEPQLNKETRAAFMKYAQKDESGDYYLDEPNFIEAIAPATEDYVSSIGFSFSVLARKLTGMFAL
jgi:solute carrier family 25 (mitochondrial aspartate/glutamate transporter), member 12/13